MRTVFADTLYWAALINPKDQWHSRAVAVGGALIGACLITTDEVLCETLNFFSGYGESIRRNTVAKVRAILINLNIEIVSQTHSSFLDGLALYESRLDKGYSLTDCVSMNVMKARGVMEVLTHDYHFAQEGFTILL